MHLDFVGVLWQAQDCPAMHRDWLSFLLPLRKFDMWGCLDKPFLHPSIAVNSDSNLPFSTAIPSISTNFYQHSVLGEAFTLSYCNTQTTPQHISTFPTWNRSFQVSTHHSTLLLTYRFAGQLPCFSAESSWRIQSIFVRSSNMQVFSEFISPNVHNVLWAVTLADSLQSAASGEPYWSIARLLDNCPFWVKSHPNERKHFQCTPDRRLTFSFGVHQLALQPRAKPPQSQDEDLPLRILLRASSHYWSALELKAMCNLILFYSLPLPVTAVVPNRDDE
jgi:hypothetical protein